MLKKLAAATVLAVSASAHAQEALNMAHFALLDKCRQAMRGAPGSPEAAKTCIDSEAAMSRAAPFSQIRMLLLFELAVAAENQNPALTATPGAKAYHLKIAEISPMVNKKDPDHVVVDLLNVALYFDRSGDWAGALGYFERAWSLARQSKTDALRLEKRVLDEVDSSFRPRAERATPGYSLQDHIAWKQRVLASEQANSGGSDDRAVADAALALGKLHLAAKDAASAAKVTRQALEIYQARGDGIRAGWAEKQLKSAAAGP